MTTPTRTGRPRLRGVMAFSVVVALAAGCGTTGTGVSGTAGGNLARAVQRLPGPATTETGLGTLTAVDLTVVRAAAGIPEERVDADDIATTAARDHGHALEELEAVFLLGITTPDLAELEAHLGIPLANIDALASGSFDGREAIGLAGDLDPTAIAAYADTLPGWEGAATTSELDGGHLRIDVGDPNTTSIHNPSPLDPLGRGPRWIVDEDGATISIDTALIDAHEVAGGTGSPLDVEHIGLMVAELDRVGASALLMGGRAPQPPSDAVAPHLLGPRLGMMAGETASADGSKLQHLVMAFQTAAEADDAAEALGALLEVAHHGVPGTFSEAMDDLEITTTGRVMNATFTSDNPILWMTLLASEVGVPGARLSQGQLPD